MDIWAKEKNGLSLADEAYAYHVNTRALGLDCTHSHSAIREECMARGTAKTEYLVEDLRGCVVAISFNVGH